MKPPPFEYHDPDTMEELALDITDLESLIEKLEAYPESNLDLLESNRDALDVFLSRLTELESGEDVSEEAPVESEPGK